MYVELKNVFVDTNNAEKSISRDLAHNAKNELKWNYQSFINERYLPKGLTLNDIVDVKNSPPKNEREKICRRTCQKGGKYCTSLIINTSDEPKTSKCRGMFLGFVISPKTCRLISKYFVGLKKLTLNCTLDKISLKILCGGSLNKLEHLKLHDCFWLTDRSLRYLEKLPLKKLQLNRSGNIKKGVLHLSKSTTLKNVELANFLKVNNKLFLKLLTDLAYQATSVSVRGKCKVILNEKLEEAVKTMLVDDQIKRVKIHGTTIVV